MTQLAPHDRVRLTRHERRTISRIAVCLGDPPRRHRPRRRIEPATLLAVGLLLVVAGAIASSVAVVALGSAVAGSALVLSAVRRR